MPNPRRCLRTFCERGPRCVRSAAATRRRPSANFTVPSRLARPATESTRVDGLAIRRFPARNESGLDVLCCPVRVPRFAVLFAIGPSTSAPPNPPWSQRALPRTVAAAGSAALAVLALVLFSPSVFASVRTSLR